MLAALTEMNEEIFFSSSVDDTIKMWNWENRH